MKTVGDRIAELRKAKGWTQEDLGREAGVHEKTIAKWEQGVQVPGRQGNIAKVSRALGVSVDELLYGGEGTDNVPRATQAAEEAAISAGDRIGFDGLPLTGPLMRQLLDNSVAFEGNSLGISRFTLIQIVERAFVERGVPVPEWLEEIRAEIIADISRRSLESARLGRDALRPIDETASDRQAGGGQGS